MLISLNEIKKLVPIPETISTDELVHLIGSRLVEIEGTEELAPKYAGCYVVKVVSAEPIPETHLHLCKIDAGEAGREFAEDFAKKHPGEELTTDEHLVQVVCGAPNVHAGMFAVWIKPGAIVPETYGGENFKLDVRKLRGFESYGMLAGADELALDTEHKFIAEIEPKGAIAGQPLIEKFDLDDIILDIENKSLTHRPDTFGLIGFAREVAGILGIKFEEPKNTFKIAGETRGARIKVEIKDTELCPRYSCTVFTVDEAGLDTATEATKYLTDEAVFLAKAGMRSISKIVDATNIVMLKTGQPLHAFDYDKFMAIGKKIVVRAAKAGETLKLLDGKTIELLSTDIVIAADQTPVALAGAMGGESTEIDESTKTVILESATFSLYNERKMQMTHGIFSEAITRFTKGQPTTGTIPALELCASMLLSEPSKISQLVDEWPDQKQNEPIAVTREQINALLGTNYADEVIRQTLENVGFKVGAKKDKYEMVAPAWRTDIHIKEDVIEEVGRLLGFDNIAKQFPLRPFRAAAVNPMIKLKREIRNIMSDQLGANELLTYSFVSRKLQEKVGQDPEDSYEIVNSISPELQRFRQSIVPSLLEKAQLNLKAGFRDFMLYEFNQVSRKSDGLNDEQVPILKWRLATVMCGDFYKAKAALMTLAETLHIKLELREFKTGEAYFEAAHAAEIVNAEGERLGTLGEIKSKVLKQLKISEGVAAFEIELEKLLETPRALREPLKLSKFPSVERDITFKTDKPYAAVVEVMRSRLEKIPNLVYTLTPGSIYQEEGSGAMRNLSFRLVFASTEKTLESSEISGIMESIVGAAAAIEAAVV